MCFFSFRQIFQYIFDIIYSSNKTASSYGMLATISFVRWKSESSMSSEIVLIFSTLPLSPFLVITMGLSALQMQINTWSTKHQKSTILLQEKPPKPYPCSKPSSLNDQELEFFSGCFVTGTSFRLILKVIETRSREKLWLRDALL